MRIEIKIAIINIFILFLIKSVCAQTYDELVENISEGEDIMDRLPPLAELQEQAIESSPIFKMLDSDVEIGEYKLKEEKRLWLNSIGIEGSARYGLFDNLIITEDLGILESSTSTTEQSRYYLGAYIKIPLSDIIDRSNVKTAQAEKQKLRYQREASIQELRKLIIACYNDVVKKHRGLLIKADLLESYRVQMMRAKLDFKNGNISIADYARLDQMWSKASLALEEAKLDYLTSFQILEETVGVKIKLKD